MPQRCAAADCTPDEPRLVLDGAYLCHVCRQRLRSWLEALPALHAELAEALIPGSTSGGASPSYRNGWPVNPQALGLAGDIYGKLCAWAWDIAERRCELPKLRGLIIGRTIQEHLATASEYLTQHLDWIIHRDEHLVIAFYDEIGELHRRVRTVVYPDRDRKDFPLPPQRRDCPECAAPLHAYLDCRTQAIYCTGCGAQWAPLQWHRLGRRILNQQVTA